MALVEDFTRRSLTQATDKLVAIAGLAKLILHAPRETGLAPSKSIVQGALDSVSNSKASSYVAGLWRSTFISELAWSVEELEKSGLSSYVAPSWSWASFNGPVIYKFRESLEDWEKNPKLKEYCTLDNVVFEPALSSDPSGAVNAAYAILTGPLAPVELASLDVSFVRDWDTDQKYSRQPPYEAKKSFVRAENLISVEVCLDRDHSCLEKDDDQADCWIQGRCERQCCTWDKGVSDTNAKQLFYCLRLFSWAHYEEGLDTHPELWFLVLRRSQLIEEAYERVGLGIWRDGYNKVEGPEYCPLFDGAKLSTLKVV
jgi:hypothetical protein